MVYNCPFGVSFFPFNTFCGTFTIMIQRYAMMNRIKGDMSGMQVILKGAGTQRMDPVMIIGKENYI
jgi:hypothetical protein